MVLAWDFSIATGCIMLIIIGYLTQIVRLSFWPLETRNRLTMTIWWSILLNMITLEIKQIILLTCWVNEEDNELIDYSITSIADFFFVNAIMLQCFEWDLLQQMISH